MSESPSRARARYLLRTTKLLDSPDNFAEWLIGRTMYDVGKPNEPLDCPISNWLRDKLVSRLVTRAVEVEADRSTVVVRYCDSQWTERDEFWESPILLKMPEWGTKFVDLFDGHYRRATGKGAYAILRDALGVTG